MLVKILLTVIFLAVTVYVGIYSRKQANNVDGFVLGGRSVGPWLSAFAFGTSYFSAVVFVGYAGQFGWKYGLASSWIGIGNAIIGSLLAWLILGRRTKLMTQHIKSRTMPDFFGTRFSNQGLRIAASIIAFVFLIPYTAGVYSGISKLFDMGFGIPYEYCIIIMALLTAVCDSGRLQGYSHQRLHSGHRHAGRHHRRHCCGAEQPGWFHRGVPENEGGRAYCSRPRESTL